MKNVSKCILMFLGVFLIFTLGSDTILAFECIPNSDNTSWTCDEPIDCGTVDVNITGNDCDSICADQVELADVWKELYWDAKNETRIIAEECPECQVCSETICPTCPKDLSTELSDCKSNRWLYAIIGAAIGYFFCDYQKKKKDTVKEDVHREMPMR